VFSARISGAIDGQSVAIALTWLLNTLKPSSIFKELRKRAGEWRYLTQISLLNNRQKKPDFLFIGWIKQKSA